MSNRSFALQRKHMLIALLLPLLLLALLVSRGLLQAQDTLPAAADAPVLSEATAANLGTGFTYQGRLNNGGVPAQGAYDFKFDLYDSATGGAKLGATESRSEFVDDGLFNVLLNQNNAFTLSAFAGPARWLEISVRQGGGAYTTLQPRQLLSGAPFALSLRPGATVAGDVANIGALNLANTNSNGMGLRITQAKAGVYIDQVSAEGFTVISANNGVFVKTATTHGLVVEKAKNGVYVVEATTDGLHVEKAGDGGVVVNQAAGAGLYANNVNTGVNIAGVTTGYAGYFNGQVFIGGACTGCALATFAVNSGTAVLRPGDIVSLEGSGSGAAVGQPLLLQVARAGTSGGALLGVVAGRAEMVADDGSTATSGLTPRAGSAGPGDYVHIITHGEAQVNVSALGTAVQAGDKLAANTDGAARQLQTRQLEGMTVNESAPTIGMALEGLDAGQDGRIWVLVNPQ